MGFNFTVKSTQPHLLKQRYMFYITRVNWYSMDPERYSHEVLPVEIW